MRPQRHRWFVASAIVCAATVPVAHAAAANPAPRSFAVLGDIPYSDAQLVELPSVVDQVNAAPSIAWVAHLGDVKSGGSVCSDEYYATIRAQFDRFADPLVYTPGDNDWTDCHRLNNGPYDPLERLAKVREVFFPVANRTLGQTTRKVISQSTKGVVENVRFVDGAAVIAALHVVGSSNGMLPWTGLTAPTDEQRAEVTKRTNATVQMIKQTFAQARNKGLPLVVLMMQAEMFNPVAVNPGPAQWTAYAPIVRTIAAEAGRFTGNVLLVNGDSHAFLENNPLAAGSKWLAVYGLTAPVPNLTRLTVEGSIGMNEFLKVTIDPAATRGFTYQRVALDL